MLPHRERMLAALNREVPDHLPYFDGLWGETHDRYVTEGHMRSDEDPVEHFDMSALGGGGINGIGNMDIGEEVLEEDEATRRSIRYRLLDAECGFPLFTAKPR